MVKGVRKPRPRKPTEVPLDDGARNGTEHWRELGGVRFCHWDRWLLRLAMAEPMGLQSIAHEFRRRSTAGRGPNPDAEAMLAQVLDLDVRLERLALTPDAALDEVERKSKWLHDKAFRRVWHASSISKTPAMLATPRNTLDERAMRGNWAAFTVSPAPYVAELKAAVGDGWYGYRGTGLVVTLLENASERLLRSARTAAERLAVHRAGLTVAIGAMDQVDDSDADLAVHFREQERQYLDLLRAFAEGPGLLRDLLELVVWEDYGLFSRVEPFLTELPEAHADIAKREIAKIIAELRVADLDYQLKKALSLQQGIVAAA